jgi:hypothetical protein
VFPVVALQQIWVSRLDTVCLVNDAKSLNLLQSSAKHRAGSVNEGFGVVNDAVGVESWGAVVVESLESA